MIILINLIFDQQFCLLKNIFQYLHVLYTIKINRMIYFENRAFKLQSECRLIAIRFRRNCDSLINDNFSNIENLVLEHFHARYSFQIH